MSEFTETIWEDKNLKIVVEKIMQSKEDLAEYEHEMCQLIILSGKLDEIRNSIQRRPDRNVHSNINSQHWTNNEVHPPGWNCALAHLKKKNVKAKEVKPTKMVVNQKEKPITVDGKALNQLETDDLINYINGNYKEDSSKNNNNNKGKKNKKKNKNSGTSKSFVFTIVV